MKNISPKIKVGGAGFALGYDNFHYGQLLGNWKKRNIQPDFISVYAYSYLLQQQNGVYFGRRSIDNSFIKNQLELFKKELEKLDFSIPELIISEWNLTISNRNRINDSCGLAAYIVKNCIECESEADMMGYWLLDKIRHNFGNIMIIPRIYKMNSGYSSRRNQRFYFFSRISAAIQTAASDRTAVMPLQSRFFSLWITLCKIKDHVSVFQTFILPFSQTLQNTCGTCAFFAMACDIL